MTKSRLLFTAGRRLGMTVTLLSMFVVFRPMKAAEITVTITGTLEGGGDSFPIFDVGKSLDGKPFTLVYTFDDAKGLASPIAGCKGAASGIEGDGPNSPATAVLTVGTKSYTFGLGKNAHSAIWREIASPCSESQIAVEIHEGKDPFSQGVSVRIKPGEGKRSLTQNPDWRAPLASQDMDPLTFGSAFVICRVGDFYHQAKAGFFVKSVAVSG